MAGKKTSTAPSKKSQYRIEKRGDGRWAVRQKGGKHVHGAEKAKALFDAGKIPEPKAKAKAAEEAPAAT